VNTKKCWTLTWKAYKIWCYERGYGRPKWKVSMIYINAIDAQAEGGALSNLGSIITPIIDSCLWVEHVNQWRVNLTPIT
jgi:hypothetical protein